jgi:hypothetical protein
MTHAFTVPSGGKTRATLRIRSIVSAGAVRARLDNCRNEALGRAKAHQGIKTSSDCASVDSRTVYALLCGWWRGGVAPALGLGTADAVTRGRTAARRFGDSLKEPGVRVAIAPYLVYFFKRDP